MTRLSLYALTICVLLPGLAVAQAQPRCDAEALALKTEVFAANTLAAYLDIEPAVVVEATRDCRSFSTGLYSQLLMNAALSGDVGLRPMLRQIVANRAFGEREDWFAAKAALLPLAWLGEDPAYFVDLAQVLTRPYGWDELSFGVEAATAVSLQPDSSWLAPLAALAASTAEGPQPDRKDTGLRFLRQALEKREEYRALPTLRARLAHVLDRSPLWSELCRAQHDRPGKLCRPVDVRDMHWLALLRDAADAHPDSFRTYLPVLVAELFDGSLRRDAYRVDAFVRLAHQAALPFEPYPYPSEAPDADVRPVLECVEEREGGALVAYFGYESRTGAPVTVPRGLANAVTPLTLDGRQPEAFGVPRAVGQPPGRTAPFPAFAWRALLPPGGVVTWTLPGGSATASASSPRCRDVSEGLVD